MKNEASFQKLTGQQRSALFKGAVRLTFGPGDVIIRQGETQDSIYVMDSGQVRVERRLRVRAKYMIEDGELRVQRSTGPQDETYTNVEIARLGEGSVFGEMSYLDPLPVSANVIAEGEVAVLRIDAKTIDRLMKEDPAFAAAFYHSLATTLARRLRVTSSRAAGRFVP